MYNQNEKEMRTPHENAHGAMTGKPYSIYIKAIKVYNETLLAFQTCEISTDNPPKAQAVLIERYRSKIDTIEELYGLDKPF